MIFSFRPKILLGTVLIAVIGVSVACSDSSNDAASTANQTPAGGASCGTPQEGCSCTTPGAQVVCGKKLTGDQNFVYCYEGVRTCLSTGLYGGCESGSVVEHSTSTQAVHITALATTSACNATITGSINVCTAGRQQGEPCNGVGDCTNGVKMCAGGSDSTSHCRDDHDCNVACTRFDGNCSGGPTPNIGCNATADCGAGGTCTFAGGAGTCAAFTGICDSFNATDGHECNQDTDCGAGGQCVTGTAKGTCLGGFRNGRRCHFNRQCFFGTCTADLGDGGAGTSGTLDPCDPYCQVYADNPIGFDAGTGWTLVDGGLTPNAGCGNSVLNAGEHCDDGNKVSGDGCSASCQLEVGFFCPTVGAACQASTCGNGTVEGLEQCDDSNTFPYDGCSPKCTWETTCPATSQGGCTSKCGDGIKFPSEDCDDGNIADGDGCDHDCKVELGSSCVTVLAPAPPSIDVPVIYRDFSPNTHPDFQKVGSPSATIIPHRLNPDGGAPPAPYYYGGTGPTPNCGANLQRGIPAFELANDKRPALRSDPLTVTAATTNCVASAGSFLDWYHPAGSTSVRIDGRVLRLFRQGDGSYLFDTGTDTVVENKVNCGNGSANSDCKYQTGFYPINGQGLGNYTGGKNYHFTSEVHYPFTYAGNEELSFTGDDDVFVYVNNRLVADLGGVHGPQTKVVTLHDTTPLDPASAGSVALTPGSTYEIAVFQAERNTTGSNYQLTLRGFNQTKSVCTIPPPPTMVTRDFEAVCAQGEMPVWQLFRWKAAVAPSESINFSAATRDDLATMPGSSSDSTIVQVATATSATVPTVWGFDPTPVSARLASAAPPQLSKRWLRIFMQFNGTPQLREWQQMYDCVPVE